MLPIESSYPNGYKRKKIIVLDGPPASGKTSIAHVLKDKTGAFSITYKRLGFANIISALLLHVSPIIRGHACLERLRCDPITELREEALQRLSNLVFLLEVLYKIMQQFLILLLTLFLHVIIVDEWFSLGWANYFNLYLRRGLKAKHVEILIRLDMAFFKLLSSLHSASLQLIFIDRDLNKVKEYWVKRGHKIPYDVKFYKLTYLAFNILKNSYPNSSSCKIVVVSSKM